MAELSTGAKLFLGVVVGTGLLFATSAYAESGTPQPWPTGPGGSGGGTSNKDAEAAAQADQVFGAALAAANGIVAGSTSATGVAVSGAASLAVSVAWKKLSTKDKAGVWRGEVK